MSDGVSEALPPPFSEWMKQALGVPPQRETMATCEDCTMCRAPAEAVDHPPFLFHPSVKCCTYLPELPNFSVGRILRDESAALATGRRSVLDRIAAGNGVTPLGLEQTREFRERYRPDDPSFGREPRYRCPHFETGTGQCGIWPYRESTCSTWSCKHDRGALGQAYRAALRELLKEVERQLAWWCATEMGLEAPALAQLASLPVNPLAAESGAGPWGTWKGRPEEWYTACAERVRDLTWDDVLRITGPDVEARLRICRRTRDRHQEFAIPSRIRPRPEIVVAQGDAFVRVTGYSPYDPLDLPEALANVLPQFDGRPTDEVVAKVVQEHGVYLAPEIVRSLLDFEVLVPFEETVHDPGDRPPL